MKINYMSADEAVKLIENDDHVFIQGSTSTPEVLVEALSRRAPELRNVTLYSAFAVAKGEAPYCKEEYADSFNVESFFVSNSVREFIAKGYGSMIPRF